MHATPTSDVRVEAVLAVLRGGTVDAVAEQHGVEPALLERWLTTFLDAGTSAVTNTPREDEAAGRDRFLAAISHELRTPITMLKGWAMLMERPDLAEQQRVQGARIIAASVTRLEHTVSLVEDTAAASLGRLRLSPQAVDVHDVLARFTSSIAEVPDPLPPRGELALMGDPTRVVQVLDDLVRVLGDAPDTTRLSLGVEAEPAWVRLQVRRDGDPLPPATVHAFFEPFAAREGEADVTFGLYRTRALVVAQQGQLGVDGHDDHEIFWIRLPRIPTARPSTDGTDHP